MRYQFLIDTYETERLKVLSVWSMFESEDLTLRPHPSDPRGRTPHEQMVHQCVSEDGWFKNMLNIDVGAPPLPQQENKLEFIRRYAADSERRLEALRGFEEAWWEAEVRFFDVARSRAWVVTRRLTHTAHHRGQQTSMLRMLNRELYSTYGPTADTGGLPSSGAQVIYPYPDLGALLEHAAASGSGDPPSDRAALTANIACAPAGSFRGHAARLILKKRVAGAAGVC